MGDAEEAPRRARRRHLEPAPGLAGARRPCRRCRTRTTAQGCGSLATKQRSASTAVRASSRAGSPPNARAFAAPRCCCTALQVTNAALASSPQKVRARASSPAGQGPRSGENPDRRCRAPSSRRPALDHHPTRCAVTLRLVLEARSPAARPVLADEAPQFAGARRALPPVEIGMIGERGARGRAVGQERRRSTSCASK